MNCTMLATRIIVHNVVQHSRDVSLYKSPGVEGVSNQPNVASAYGPGLGIHPPPPPHDRFISVSQEDWVVKLVL